MVVKYGTTSIAYTVERKSSLKNTYINVDKHGVVVKTNENTTEEELEQYVIQKASWITKHLKGYSIQSDIEIVTGARLYYLGKSYYVEVIETEIDKVIVEFIHSKFKIHIPIKCSQIAMYKAIDLFYKERAMKKIMPLVRKWSKRMEVTPEHISFRKSEKRWGSCSTTDRISFNYELMKIHSALIEYVVVHELSHIKYKNHSKEFWHEVQKFLPDYKKREEHIKIFEKLF